VQGEISKRKINGKSGNVHTSMGKKKKISMVAKGGRKEAKKLKKFRVVLRNLGREGKREKIIFITGVERGGGERKNKARTEERGGGGGPMKSSLSNQVKTSGRGTREQTLESKGDLGKRGRRIPGRNKCRGATHNWKDNGRSVTGEKKVKG